ncbi:Metallo-hydrolase/oxidoreductase [Schizopora paradoxa]|uniref:Metallo-hydrolase/oxidoreductase n=1 Tax=Schizopora paradoxa TaxID=27342 RepID=A0A0H2RKT4_9AGAM|nr:Metallo-hydrolase/oxidoreductase [Schizopora paradoxa]
MIVVNPLPPPSTNQAFCDVSALEGGMLDFPCKMAVASAAADERKITPALAFLVTHSTTKQQIVFDLGVRKDIENVPGPAYQRVANIFKAQVVVDVPDALAKGGVKVEDVKTVILSHVHWDHVGDTHLYPNARFVVGADCRQLFEPGWPEDPTSKFASDLLPPGRTDYLSPEDESWKPLGPFAKALDYFGDGSMYIVDAPGHLQGHVNLLARTSADGGWIYLAGDSAHDWRLVHGESIAESHTPEGGHVCMHVDKVKAEDTIRRIAEVMKLPSVRVVLAHDAEWFAENRGGTSFWPGKIPSL